MRKRIFLFLFLAVFVNPVLSVGEDAVTTKWFLFRFGGGNTIKGEVVADQLIKKEQDRLNLYVEELEDRVVYWITTQQKDIGCPYAKELSSRTRKSYHAMTKRMFKKPETMVLILDSDGVLWSAESTGRAPEPDGFLVCE